MLRRYTSSEGGHVLVRRMQFLWDDVEAELDRFQLDNGREVLLERAESPHAEQGGALSPRRARGGPAAADRRVSFTRGASSKLAGTPGASAYAREASTDLSPANGVASGAAVDEYSPRRGVARGPLERLVGRCSGHSDFKVVVAMGHWSDALDSHEANAVVVETLVENGVNDIYCLPLSTGGRGWLKSFRTIFADDGCEIVNLDVRSPISDKMMITIPMALCKRKKAAVIDGDSIVGPHLIGDGQASMANSYGLGQAIREACEMGAKTIYLGLPAHTACFDGGVGMAQALGVEFLDAEGNELPHVGNVSSQVAHMNTDMMDQLVMGDCKIICGCESSLPLLGESSIINGLPDAAQRDALKLVMTNLSDVVTRSCSNQTACLLDGSGSAGGVAFMLSVLLVSELMPGITTLCQDHLEKQIAKADLLVTGAFNVDLRSASSLPVLVAKVAQKHGTRTVVYTAQTSQDIQDAPESGINCIVPIPEGNQVRTDAEIRDLLARQITRTVKMLRIGNHVKL